MKLDEVMDLALLMAADLPLGPEATGLRTALLDARNWYRSWEAVRRGAGGQDPALTRGLGWSEV